MTTFPVGNTYIFLVHTNAYAGNFEREMCAYMTGHIGECEVGHRSKAKFHEETSITQSQVDDGTDRFSFVIKVANEDGCYRPASCWPSEEGLYTTVAIFMSRAPTSEEVAFLKRRAELYCRDGSLQIPLLGFGLQMFSGEIQTLELPE